MAQRTTISNASRDSTLSLATQALTRFGFREESVRRSFPILLDKANPRWEIDAIAFSEPMAQPQNASITIHIVGANQQDSALVRSLSISTAPFHLLFYPDSETFSFWLAEIRDEAVAPRKIKAGLVPNRLADGLAEYAADLNPRTIRKVKQGLESFRHPAFASVRPLQLSLFTEQVTEPLLVSYFSHALAKLRKHRLGEVSSSKIATQLLAARVLNDTKVFRRPVGGVREILSAAKTHAFQRYFDSDLLTRHQVAADEAFELLKEISFSTFSPEMLRSVYAAAYPEEVSKERGRFDTPLYLTHRIWENLPVETLRPEQRIVTDMTCGWGSFLIAGYERLSAMKDMEGIALHKHLIGNDSDALTANLASLALLLSSGRDSWKVEAEDALSWDWLSRNRPGIIVGNPPFASNRKNENETGETRRRKELANDFLNRAIDRLAPGGLLAMIMPGSFIDGEASPDTRKFLLDSSDVQEIWELPQSVFEKASVRPLVIFAKKMEGKTVPVAFPTKIRNLQPQKLCLSNFQLEGTFTRSTFAPDQSQWTKSTKAAISSKVTHVFDYTTILSNQEWAQIRAQSANLSDVAFVMNGAIPGTPAKGKYADFANPKQVPWLGAPADAMPGEFVLQYTQAKKTYPNDFQWPRYENRGIFETDKILLTSVKNPRWGRRVNLAIDRRGFYVPHNYFIVSPMSSEHPVEVLAAVLRWRVSNTWLLECMFSPWVSASQLKTVPYPTNLTATDKATLKQCILALECEAQKKEGDSHDAEATIDRIFRRAYGLSDRVWKVIDDAFHWDSRYTDILSFDASPARTADAWKTRGITEAVNPQEGTIELWLEGRAFSDTVAIDERMPGWMLRPGAAFEVTLPRSVLRNRRITQATWGRFTPQPYSYLEAEELEERFKKVVSKA